MLDPYRLRVLLAVARTGSVTAAARSLNLTQPAVSHHLARLEAETGAQVMQRVGRGIRLTEAGQVLAERAAEILGRIDSAAAELESYVGLSAGRVRVAGYSSALVALLPQVAAIFERDHPGLRLELVDTHPPEALAMLRAGDVDAAVVFQYDREPRDVDGVQLQYLRADPTYLLTLDTSPTTVAQHRDDRWVGGCDRCREHLIDLCEGSGFDPRIAYATDDMVAIQALVAAGMGVATIPGLALEAHRHPEVRAHEIPGAERYIFLATYGEPPNPPPVGVLREALAGLG